MLRLIARFCIFLATMALLTGVSFFVVGAYLFTWPILRQSPRTRRKRAMQQVAVSLFTLAQTFQPEEEPEETVD